jgi:hypothetical protein
VQRIDPGVCARGQALGAALPVILKTHAHREGEQAGKAFPERRVAGNFAPDVAEHAAEPNAQELERAPGPLELMGMRVAPDHDRGALGNASVALPQWHVMAPREIDQFFQCAMTQPRIGPVRDGLGLYRVPTTTRSRSRFASAPVLCATAWISATSCSSPSRWRQCVSDERSNDSRWQKLSSPQKNW